ncbi:MAG: hypothetical protein K2L11_09715 [Muribaculaceae bacterium]|nr:hypothetical protein [Muribaculaceae bacterium]
MKRRAGNADRLRAFALPEALTWPDGSRIYIVLSLKRHVNDLADADSWLSPASPADADNVGQ